ncbi:MULTISPECIES: hypothetical protein [Bradyrhizobium]|uniref:hypothetical protein n=1 Tax=Bradyrhizobium TaxID=374 RepID=UPI0004BAC2DD|nr:MULTISPECIES: hypothetical protein [Bradyrhizobium]MBR0945249.1 hypothetical protein [Bradyrhizobium liaoningense]
MHDDSWRDGYDDWKLASPDDDYEEPCEHRDTEVDILDGDVRCVGCGETWSATPAELSAELEHQAAYFELEARELRRRWWRDLVAKVTSPVRWPIHRLLERVWPRKSLVILRDDEIPF